ncbi:ABC transporter [Mycolicibacterium sp.]|uniref:ABC transporter n=1 Tax=Mycolicibacterium sp. TaxID=2320850 RepID=UPI0037CB8518
MRIVVGFVCAVVLLAGCSADEKPATPTTSAAGDDTGIDAQESSEPVTRLVIVEPETGATVVFDAGEATETRLGELGPTHGVSGDGRFAYLRGDDALAVVDAGSWTFDHGDHSHYYVEPPAVAGRVDGRFTAAHGQRDLATAQREDGTVAVLDRKALGEHQIKPFDRFGELRDIAAAAPLGEDVVVVTRDGAVTVIGTSQSLGRCPGVTGVSTVGRDVVFGCADGAVRIVRRAGALTAEPMPLPGEPPHPGALVYRYGSTTLTGVAEDTVWVLDGRRGSWKRVAVPDVVAANSVSADSVLALTADGQLRAFATNDGRQTAAVPLLRGPIRTGRPVVEVDADRAYVNDAQGRAVYEIDYRDGLRVARTFKTSIAPGFMVETGR